MSPSGPVDSRPYLDPDPPPWAARALAAMILLIVSIATVVAIAVKVPETVRATFTVVPFRGTDPITAFRSGVVREARVVTGQRVSAGERLFVIAAPEVGDRTGELRGVVRQLSEAEAQRGNLRRVYEEQLAADQHEQARLIAKARSIDERLAIDRRELGIAQEIYRRYAESHKQGLISWIEVGRTEADVTRLQSQIAAVEGERQDVRESLARLEKEVASRKAAFEEQSRAATELRDKAQIRRGVLTDDPAAAGTLLVQAPCAGTILQAAIVLPGTAVKEGDRLTDIACDGERLQARLAIPQRGLGQLRVGQAVKLLFDAFPYERFGAVPATVTWVSPAGLAGGDGSFAAFAALTEREVKGRPVGAGMTGEADVIVGRRRLASYLIDPLRQLREDLK
jgi:membrane fusion protein